MRRAEQSVRLVAFSELFPTLFPSPGTTGNHAEGPLSLRIGNDRSLTRAQVATRIGTSVPTVRRYEGTLLHPEVDDKGVHWFDPKDVTSLAASRANAALARGKIRNAADVREPRTRGELAALVFERFEQRHSQAEIVIGLRVEPETVRELFDQYCRGLVDAQLDRKQPNVVLDSEVVRVDADELERRLAALPEGEATRISVGRYRGPTLSLEGDSDYAWIIELGGFLVSGPCEAHEITCRYGRGSDGVTAYGFEPNGIRWEVIVKDLNA